MRTISFYLPENQVNSFITFMCKSQKKVKGLTYTIGKVYDKVFRHATKDEDGHLGLIKQWHSICDATIELPDINNWELVASYEKDILVNVGNSSKEMHFINPNHGATYHVCDMCGHKIKNSFVVYNSVTKEELQVGTECLKKFGLNGVISISKFVSELYKSYNCYMSDTEDEPMWIGSEVKEIRPVILKSELIKAVKAYYNENPYWIKGYYDKNNNYIRSKSSIEIENNLYKKVYAGDDKYIDDVCEYTIKTAKNSEFEENMKRLSQQFYAKLDDIVYAFFMVKTYEDGKRQSPTVTIGTQVKVIGQVIEQKQVTSMYGPMTINTIKTNSYIVERCGKIPTTISENKTFTSFYAIVKANVHNKLILDRASTKPKKGMEVIEL